MGIRVRLSSKRKWQKTLLVHLFLSFQHQPFSLVAIVDSNSSWFYLLSSLFSGINTKKAMPFSQRSGSQFFRVLLQAFWLWKPQPLPLFLLLSGESAMLFNHSVLCCSLLLLPSSFPSMRVFSNESALLIRWPKYRSFSFSISPSNEYSGQISFRINWFDLLVVLRDNQEYSPAPQFKSINSLVLSILYSPTLTSIHN